MSVSSSLAIAFFSFCLPLVSGCIIPPEDVHGQCINQCSKVGCPCSFCATAEQNGVGVCEDTGFCKVYPSDWEGLSACGATGGSAGSAGSTSSGGTAGQGGTGGSGGSTSSGGTAGQGGSINCGAGTKECNGSCVVADDPNYGCDDATCAPCDITNAAPVCVSSTCGIGSCAPGFEDCNVSASDGCETNLMNDAMNCGSCGTACLANQPCAQGECLPLCGKKAVPATGYAACWLLDKDTLAVGTFGTMTVKIGAPAPSGPSDPVDCVSSVSANANNGNDSSVLCPLTGLTVGQSAHMAFKSYSNGDLAAANPPLPFSAFKCDNGLSANPECTSPVQIYKDGVLITKYVPPASVPFTRDGIGVDAPIQLVYTP